eukprot:IDg19374t1
MNELRYCSNPACATPFDYEEGGPGPCVICPLCDTATCAECIAPWHAKQSCAEARPDGALDALAAQRRWRRCPSCTTLVDRVDGCNFVRCRCGTGFCYACGVAYVDDPRASLDSAGQPRANQHGTPACNCPLFPRNGHAFRRRRAFR